MLKNLLMNLLRAPVYALRTRRERRVMPALESAVSAFNEKKYAEVVTACTVAIAREPRSAQAHHLCGRALVEMGREAEAESYLQAAVKAEPGLAEAHAALASIRLKAGDCESAETSCRKAIAVHRTEVRYRLLLVDILEAAGRDRDAFAELTVAQECAPEQLDLLIRVCTELDRLDRHPEMLVLAERAVIENGENLQTLNCLALARFGVDDLEGAVEACRKALALRADMPATHVTLGSALYELGRMEEALAAHRRALKLDPKLASSRYVTGLIHLMRGRYREGWEGFDQRLRVERNRSWRACEPRWNGTSLRGRSVLIMREQGLGDEIMHASCYPDLIGQAARCSIECDTRLEELFKRSFPGATFFPLKDLDTKVQTDPGVPVDVRSYAGSLPRYLRSGLRDFPAHQGYLQADPAKVEHWRARCAGLGAGLKVGISWRGGTAVTRRDRRSLSLQALLPLLSVPGVRWVNLQYGARAAEIAELKKAHGIGIADWPEAIDDDYDATAALVGALDLVISVCTAVVHLTGALGRPVWVMAPYVPEWRYGLQGEAMPWYPSARLFRQTARGEWDKVIGRVTNELTQRTGAQ